MMDLSIPYYEDTSRISNSNIGWFLNKGPSYLHKMLTEDVPEEKNPVLERGTMIHEYILQPEEFQKDYVVWNKSRPSSTQQEKFCQALAFSLEIEPNKAILSAYKDAYSTKGKTDEYMLSEGLKIASMLKDYIDYLKSRDERKIISINDAKMLEKIKNNILSHKLASILISPADNIESHHEFHINWDFEVILDDKYNVKCKSLLDSITFDFKNKICTITDLKTTAKLWHFEDSISMYDYCRQLAYYTMAARWYLRNERNEDIDKWEFKWYIIGIDTVDSNDIRVFSFKKENITDRGPTIFSALHEIAWHQYTNNWDHSREYYEGDGSEQLYIKSQEP